MENRKQIHLLQKTCGKSGLGVDDAFYQITSMVDGKLRNKVIKTLHSIINQ